jgi:hypothetical protein
VARISSLAWWQIAESALKECQGVCVEYSAHISHSGAPRMPRSCDGPDQPAERRLLTGRGGGFTDLPRKGCDLHERQGQELFGHAFGMIMAARSAVATPHRVGYTERIAQPCRRGRLVGLPLHDIDAIARGVAV